MKDKRQFSQTEEFKIIYIGTAFQKLGLPIPLVWAMHSGLTSKRAVWKGGKNNFTVEKTDKYSFSQVIEVNKNSDKS